MTETLSSGQFADPAPHVQSTVDPHSEERAKLRDTVAEIRRQIVKLDSIPRYYGDDLVEQSLDDIREQRRKALKMTEPEPYFGRLDFQEASAPDPTPLYIGKFGIQTEPTGDVLVIDWRAPVASLFYSFTGQSDDVSYEAPEETVHGVIHRKRNLAIRDQELLRVVDSYVRGAENLGISDEFLLYRLGENKDNRLRDIVSTIQSEQDQIIRADRAEALVIQGAAGSGKTTVALHRLAFLLYQFQARMRAERMIILAPNAMFLDYIGDVLPELGVGNIQQTTFAKWALDWIGRDIELADDPDRLDAWFDPTRSDWPTAAVIQWKGSMVFRAQLETHLAVYEQTCVPEESVTPWDGFTIPASAIRAWYDDAYQHLPVGKRRDRVLARLRRTVEIAYKEIRDGDTAGTRKKLAGTRLKAYEKRWPAPDALAFYTAALTRAQAQWPLALQSIRTRGRRTTVQLEDLAPLVYLQQRFFGPGDHDPFDHVVIDEAQDFSPFQVSVLRDVCPSQSFTILGDVAQGIYAFQGVNDWDSFLALFPEAQRAYFQLDRSYRSTTEIIHFANAVISQCGESISLARPVFRSGEPVRVVRSSMGSRLRTWMTLIERGFTDGASTVALVTRTVTEAEAAHRDLTAAGYNANCISAQMTHYQGGLSVIPVHLTKGLEFDAVILADVDAVRYSSTALDAKLLYVGCTRALHQLTVVVTGDVSPLLAGIDSGLYDEQGGDSV